MRKKIDFSKNYRFLGISPEFHFVDPSFKTNNLATRVTQLDAAKCDIDKAIAVIENGLTGCWQDTTDINNVVTKCWVNIVSGVDDLTTFNNVPAPFYYYADFVATLTDAMTNLATELVNPG